MPVAGFRKPAGIGLKPMTVKCLTHTRHDRGSNLELVPIPAGIPAGFGRYVCTHIPTRATPVHISILRLNVLTTTQEALGGMEHKRVQHGSTICRLRAALRRGKERKIAFI